MTTARRLSHRGFTLAEIMVTMAVMTIVGLMVFLVLNSGMVLYAKNTAVNSAHQQARSGVDQMLSNIHNAVSIPELVDTNLQPVAVIGPDGSPTPAPGISYQTFSGGPFPVVVNAVAADTAITLFCPGGYVPPANVRVEIPSHNIELDATSSVGIGGFWRFNFASPIGTDVSISGTGIEGGSGVTYVITAFLTTRSSYAVIQTSLVGDPFAGELRYYPTNQLNNLKVITRNLVSDKPFIIPILPGGALQNRFIAAVNLSTVEPNFTQRGYAAVNMFINSRIPFRCRMTTLQ